MINMSNTCTDKGDHLSGTCKCKDHDGTRTESVNDNSHKVQESSNNSRVEEVIVLHCEVQQEHHARWHLLSHLDLPDWLRDNPFLSHYHRPPMPSFGSCFKSIFKVHTETGNIWTHLVGFIAFVGITLYMFLRPITATSPFPKDWQERLVFGAFFACGIICLGFSWIFHTVHCHSNMVSKIFRRLDYAGIVLFIMGSFIPPLYYAFYCSRVLKTVYMTLTCTLGATCIIVSLWSKFNKPKYRILRAGLLVAFGWSGIIPAVHLISVYEATLVMRQVAVEWIVLMCVLYTASAVTYATRIPERFFPGKFDIWFQSHQIFHVLVVIAAFVHLYGICQMAYYRFEQGSSCET